MHWKAVPWYLGERNKIAATKRQEVDQGREWPLRLVDLLPELRVVLCLGNAARDAVAPGRTELEARGLSVLNAPHPSQRRYNVTQGSDEVRALAAFREAMILASVTR